MTNIDQHLTTVQAATDAEEAHEHMWDAERPDWRELSTDPEARLMVPENDVKDAHEGVVLGYGANHRRYYPGVDGE